MREKKTLGIIHASHITIKAMQPYIEKYLPDIEIMHLCDDTIQRDNIAAGAGIIPKVNYFKFAQYAHNLEEAGVELILLACSTFNYAAELGRTLVNTPIMQIDRTMMEEAVNIGRRIGLLATLETTVPSSERLLDIVAGEAGKTIERETILIPEAFEAYARGDIEAHNRMLTDAIADLATRVDCIVMAQLSMSVLSPYLKDVAVPVFNSGDTCFARLKAMLQNEER